MDTENINLQLDLIECYLYQLSDISERIDLSKYHDMDPDDVDQETYELGEIGRMIQMSVNDIRLSLEYQGS